MYIRESIQFNGKELALETGQIARQAGGAVLATHGDTHVLVTVVTEEPREDIGYFPLRVDYEERFYASGKIPGGFFKREGRPSDVAVLSGRMIDRPIRPLFPKGYMDEVQIIATILSAEPDCSPSALAILGASAALMISDAPFQGPIAGVKVGRVDGRLVLDPNAETVEETGVEITVAGTREAVTMVEGMMNELKEPEVVEAIDFAHNAIRELIALQERFVAQVGPVKPEFVAEEPAGTPGLIDRVRQIVWSDFSAIHSAGTKKERGDFVEGLQERAVEAIVGPGLEEEEAAALTEEVAAAIEELLEEYMRKEILERGVRLDGRRPEEIRPINCRVGVLPRTHGSSLFTRGETQSLGIITLGAARGDEQIIDQMMFDGRKRFMLHYNFPPFSVGEVRRIGSPSRRSIGHGHLAEHSLKCVLPDEEEFPYVIRVVSEILESNGSSSMATVCSASLAMMDAGVPLKKPAAGIAMGMIEDAETGRRVILTDIQGAEDHHGDMDFKVVGTRDGVTGFQLDVKVGGIDSDTMREALEQARRARLAILDEMERAIPRPREELSPYAPKLVTITIPTDKIGLVIGPGGKMIRQIIEETGAEIDIEDDGSVKIAAVDPDAVAAAQKWIEDLTEEMEVGDVFTTKVTRIADFGAFVELKGGGEGLVHVSNLADGFVDNVTDYVKVGDEVTIEVIGTDKMGRPDLKRIAPEGETPPRGDRDRKSRRERGGRGGGAPAKEKPSAPSPEVHEGDIIEGVVTNTTDYGAFVELTPEVTGLIHISALSDEYVRRVTDVVKSGDRVTVEVMNIDDRGRYKLRRVVPDEERPEAEETPEASEAEEEPEVEAEVETEREARAEKPEREAEKPEREAEEEAPPEFEDRW
jgi:polyribonucleotide nucleotidyltransferase